MTSNITALQDLMLMAQELVARKAMREFFRMFPDEDQPTTDGRVMFSRFKYLKHMEFFEAGKLFRERCFMAANQIGKTSTGGYETSAHCTGLYPEWWPGRVFTQPVRAWVAGKTNDTTRDIIQKKLFGNIIEGKRKRFDGTGLIPGDKIGAITWKQGIADLADTVRVKHNSGGWSTLGFKAFSQGRGSFEGTTQHVIWLDEEVPMDVYGECLIRTATTNGIVMLTFTPLEGMTEVAMSFMPADMRPEPESDEMKELTKGKSNA